MFSSTIYLVKPIFYPIFALFSIIFAFAFQKKSKNKEMSRKNLKSIIDTYLKSEELFSPMLKRVTFYFLAASTWNQAVLN